MTANSSCTEIILGLSFRNFCHRFEIIGIVKNLGWVFLRVCIWEFNLKWPPGDKEIVEMDLVNPSVKNGKKYLIIVNG